MNKIPKPTKEAIYESYEKIIRKDLLTMDEFDTREHMKKYHDEFQEKQPGLHEYVSKLCMGHDETMQGMIATPQFLLYIMVIVDSLYVQKDINDVKNLFEEGE